MDKITRRAALTEYRLAKPAAGIYALGFSASDAVWIGATRDLTKIENRHRFELKIGSHRCPSLQQAWREFGEANFSFDRIESLGEETPEISWDRVLKERQKHWAAKLGAVVV